MSATPDPSITAPASTLPTGTVTFALTDIEGSTLRWERAPHAMEDALRRHDAILRHAIVEHGGRVFKTIGDAFCAAFSRPEDAVAAMLEAQRALAKEDFAGVDGLRVRAAIHTGTADERDGDYFGTAANRVARLLAIGHGSQILLSGVTGDLVRDALPVRAALLDLGEHRLKDLSRPERIYQLVANDVPAEFAALRASIAPAHNLPAYRTSFVGREGDVAEIAALIDAGRLVTLSGAGGIGKTRISVRVAAGLLEVFSDGVWFVELAPIANGDHIGTTIASAIGFTLPSAGEHLEHVIRALESKEALLVFDNCEHLVESVARIASALLAACPRLKILASSRQALGIAGETLFRVPSLDVPAQAEATHLGAADALRYGAPVLFVQRARAADRRFELTDENAEAIAEICRRLDGIPLAIELAAARIKILSPRQLRDRLDERFRVLTGGSRDALPRQQTLRALIDWSYDLLEARERVLFRRLGIFTDGFTLEGAVAVGGGEDLDELEILDTLASLVDKSLVMTEPDGDALRYRLLETTRAYAIEKLDAAAERPALASRHVRYLRDRFAALWSRADRTGGTSESYEALETELHDVRAALNASDAPEDAVARAGLLAETGQLWVYSGRHREAIALCERVLAALPAGESRLRAQVAATLALLLNNSGMRSRALETAAMAVDHARTSGDPATLADALLVSAFDHAFAGLLDEAETMLSEAEGISPASKRLRLRSLHTRAMLAHFRGEFDASAGMFEQLRDEHRKLGNAPMALTSSVYLAKCEHARGRTQRAIAIVQEMLPSVPAAPGKRPVNPTNVNGYLYANLAGYLVAADDLPGAASSAREALAAYGERERENVYLSVALEHLALVFALRGDLAGAARLQSYVNAALARHGFRREYAEQRTHDRLTAILHDALEPNERERLVAQGTALTPESAIELALGEP